MASRKTPPKKHDGPGKRPSAKARIAAARAAERRRARRNWIITIAVVGVVVVALALGTAWAIIQQNRPKPLPTPMAKGSETALPPWPVPADPVAGARTAGLDVKPMEGTAKHFHAHLDIIVDGKPVPVPANLGIDPNQQAMSELHTHDATGVLHIEAPTTNKRYTLGQLFDEWQVRLSATGVGGLKDNGKNTLSAYVDGKKQTGDPASIELTAHREIALVYGPPGAKVNVPKSYEFPQGE
jgi:hypothetical protein